MTRAIVRHNTAVSSVNDLPAFPEAEVARLLELHDPVDCEDLLRKLGTTFNFSSYEEMSARFKARGLAHLLDPELERKPSAIWAELGGSPYLGLHEVNPGDGQWERHMQFGVGGYCGDLVGFKVASLAGNEPALAAHREWLYSMGRRVAEMIEARKTAIAEPNLFSFDGADVRVIMRGGEPWFVAADVCRALGYANPRKATLDHVRAKHRDGVTVRDAIGRAQETTVICEPGLYSLILRSRAEGAARFQDWVVEEVLPAIRKTGSYQTPPADPMKVLSDPAALRGLLSDYAGRVLELEAEVAETRPKAEALDRIATADGSMNVTTAAKTLGVGPRALFRWLARHDWIYRRAGGKSWLAYQHRIGQGVLEHKVTVLTRGDGSEKIVEQVMVTPKGLALLAKRLERTLAA